MAIKDIKKAVPKPLKILKYKAWELSERLKREWDTINARVNPSPIIVLGNQKSGTSAIAALLAEMTNLSVTLDLRKEIAKPTYDRVKTGELSFAEFVNINKLDFCQEIVKEPNLTLFYQEMNEYFTNPKYVFVIRDPRENIRSILNRLNIPGNLTELESEYREEITKYPAWNLVLDGSWLGIEGNNYIERLALRWNFTADVFLENKDKMELIYYEDFVKDKIGVIAGIAEKLRLPQANDIADKVDIQFQPKGNRHVKGADFFGKDNLERINQICEKKMRIFKYK